MTFTCWLSIRCTNTARVEQLCTLAAHSLPAGGVVWCDHDMHPRKLFVSMKGGKASWRCACFKELGWSDVRKVGLILFRGTCCNKQLQPRFVWTRMLFVSML
eukprot:GHRR01012190.1.p4 GENE.GHRR01012190.1~~GHRR01012190.1.p4  ORF type:complete len:102 (-),score=14.38 GHRR01012190.1:1158-1463(-)